MPSRDPRVDAYIEKSAPFARPILTHLRDVIHAACPDVEETIKWGMPHFLHHGMLAGMASFKQHVSFGFWKGRLVVGDAASARDAMGQFGRITSLDDLPSKRVLTGHVRKAMRLNEEGVSAPRTARTGKPEPAVPPELAAALSRNGAARATFEKFPPSHRREYVEWIAEAKRAETRARRVAQAVEWLAEGKQRNWKYVK